MVQEKVVIMYRRCPQNIPISETLLNSGDCCGSHMQGLQQLEVTSRVPKNKSIYTYATPHIGVWHGGIPSNVSSGGTFKVKNVLAHFEYQKTIAAHEKEVIMQE